jgi:hypothetical protein
MGNPSLTTRVLPSVVARVERCADVLAERSEEGEHRIDRGTVVRRLILLALPMLERELGLARTKSSKLEPKKRSPRARPRARAR